MPAENPYTKAILSIINEYQSLTDTAARPEKRTSPPVKVPKKKMKMPFLRQSMGEAGIMPPDQKRITE